jgi:hypothetical protein
MGNTILAHALFACGQVDLDLDKFFSATGNSHIIRTLNFSQLTAKHLLEYPNPDLACILKITCIGWWEVLRIKMSYGKWMLENPGLDNFSKFYSYKLDLVFQHLKLWQEFYQAIKDPSWPECNHPDHIKSLPTYIQKEINQLYTSPNFAKPNSSDQLVEWLSKTYYDSFLQEISLLDAAPVLELGQYIEGEYEKLIGVCQTHLGWDWNHCRSRVFHSKVIEVNSVYLTWLEEIKIATTLIINNCTVNKTFDLWEQSLIIAKACQLLNQDPHTINWNNISCNTDKNKLYLDKFTRTIHHGKTI